MSDYEIVDRIAVADSAALRDALRRHPRDGSGVRLTGRGSAQLALPAPSRPVTLISTERLDRIVRLEPDDLTCSVEPGVTREQLDTALAEHRLCLPCDGTGTLAGMFARGAATAAAPGGATPRGLLLGFEGALADGTAFKSGARVVKSVAGFDLAKLFVGSRGRLFAVSLLHLKLRPLPHTTRWCGTTGRDADRAIAAYHAVRRDPFAPGRLTLVRDDGGCSVTARYDGHGAVVDTMPARVGLPAIEAPHDVVIPITTDGEIVAGHVRPSRIATLLSACPSTCTIVVDGTGGFRVGPLAQDQSDALLAELPRLDGGGEVQHGAASRRGRATPIEPASQRLMRELTRALDPEGLLS